jgi:hypothetical protein
MGTWKKSALSRLGSVIAAICLTVALAGCASHSTARDRTPDLAGRWTFQVLTGGDDATQGAMTLVANRDGYSGTLTTDQGANTLVVRSLALDGADMRMLVESPDGNVTFEGLLSPSGASFDGTVTYHTGQRFPMSGVRG